MVGPAAVQYQCMGQMHHGLRGARNTWLLELDPDIVLRKQSEQAMGQRVHVSGWHPQVVGHGCQPGDI